VRAHHTESHDGPPGFRGEFPVVDLARTTAGRLAARRDVSFAAGPARHQRVIPRREIGHAPRAGVNARRAVSVATT